MGPLSLFRRPTVVATIAAIVLALLWAPAAAHAQSAASSAPQASSAPCNFQATQTCQSTNSTVSISINYFGDTSGCTFVWNVDWGDAHGSSDLVATDPADGWLVTAQHTYAAPGTYTISITGQVTAGNCTANAFSRTFTLTSPPPKVYSPTIHWSRTSGRPGTVVTLTGNDWVPGGTAVIHLPSTGFFIGNSSWRVGSNGSWKQRFTVARTTAGKYRVSFTEATGNLSGTGTFQVLAAPNAGQDWSKCQNGSCTIALDHQRTQVLIDTLNATPKLQLLSTMFTLCRTYTSGVILAACSVFAAGTVLDSSLIARQLSASDRGHGVFITYLTVHFTKLGITPQK